MHIINIIDKLNPPLKYPAPLIICVIIIGIKKILVAESILLEKAKNTKNKNIGKHRTPNSTSIFEKFEAPSL